MHVILTTQHGIVGVCVRHVFYAAAAAALCTRTTVHGGGACLRIAFFVCLLAGKRANDMQKRFTLGEMKFVENVSRRPSHPQGGKVQRVRSIR